MLKKTLVIGSGGYIGSRLMKEICKQMVSISIGLRKRERC